MAGYANIPIDIHCSKLLGWLQSRCHCKRSWTEQVSEIRRQITEVLKDMPENDAVSSLLSESQVVTYFECRQIVEILKHTEVGSKNLFGGYSSQRMKDWQNVLKLYEKDKVYLAEAANMLSDLSQYEIPNFKKQIAKMNTLMQDNEKKQREQEQQVVDCEKLFTKECKKYGIQGERVTHEVIGLADRLADRQDEIIKDFVNILPILEYYEKFRADLLSRPAVTLEECGIMKMFRFLVERGNVTVYEWKHKKRPNIILAPVSLEALEIDSEPVDDTIDFGDFEGEEAKHDVGIETVSPTTLETSAENLIARGTEALSILDHFVTFQLLLSNLNELLAFLKMRLMECESSAAEFALFVSDDLSPLGVDGGQLAKWIGRLEKTLAELNDPSLLHLSMLKSSPGYLDELCKRILAPRVRAEKSRRTMEVLQAKQAETSEKIVQVQHNLERSSKLAKKLQSELQDEIEKLYPGRKVNIIGSIAAV